MAVPTQWNASKPAMANQISSDVPDTEENFEEIKRILEAITNGTLGTTDSDLYKVDKADTLDLAGGQIAFPAVAAPSADPNTLDDYEEGTWVPTITATVGAFTLVTLTFANYIKTGGLVYFEAKWTITTIGTGSGSMVITLPFAADAGSAGLACVGKHINTGKIIFGATSGASLIAITYYDGTDPIVAANIYTISGTYIAA